MSVNALQLLSSYSDTDSDDERNESDESVKLNINTSSTEVKVSEENKFSANFRLPLPSTIRSLFDGNKEDHLEDNPESHDGRIRSFPHQRGNWSTYVYVPFNVGPEYTVLFDNLLAVTGSGILLKMIPEPHISLTRTVVLLHHWIDTFIDSVRQQFNNYTRFCVHFGQLAVYCNEEKTRTFLGIEVLAGHELLINSVHLLDDCLSEFQLPVFYKNPSFHVSIAWALGNEKKKLTNMLPKLQQKFQSFCGSHFEYVSLEVERFMCKCGNKLFNIDFR